MEATSQFVRPVLVDCDAGIASALEPAPLTLSEQGGYDERWLQDLLFAHPSLIPTEELEPVFGGIVPVCRELPTRVGPLDLVFINEQGLLTLVECKLWRNPEARRKVVGQILDYAQEISRWSYGDLEASLARSEDNKGKTLWQLAQEKFGLRDEATFIDRVSRHLRTGTFLLLVTGDGIRENTENIAAFLQKQAGLSFAFGLVEQRLFHLPGGKQILVQPRILAKTVEIGRLIVRAETDMATSEVNTERQFEPRRGQTLTEGMFIEEIAGTSKLADELRAFFMRLKAAGLNLDPSKRGQSLRIIPEGTRMNLLSMSRDGTVRNHGCGSTGVGQWYLAELNRLLPASQLRIGNDDGWSSTVLKQDGSYFRIEDILPLQDSLVALMQKTADRIRAADA